MRFDAVLEQIVFDESNDAQIAFVAGRIEGDKTGQKFGRCVNRARHLVSRFRRVSSHCASCKGYRAKTPGSPRRTSCLCRRPFDSCPT